MSLVLEALFFYPFPVFLVVVAQKMVYVAAQPLAM